MRLYLNNDSYPELRGITSRWQRHLTWWRAFRSALRDPRFWLLTATQSAIIVVGLLVAPRLAYGFLEVVAPHAGLRWRDPLAFGIFMAGITAGGLVGVSWGGDLIRPHLRRVSSIARASCPQCGQGLQGHEPDADDAVRCPECGRVVTAATLRAPYAIPADCRAWRRPRWASRAGQG